MSGVPVSIDFVSVNGSLATVMTATLFSQSEPVLIEGAEIGSEINLQHHQKFIFHVVQFSKIGWGDISLRLDINYNQIVGCDGFARTVRDHSKLDLVFFSSSSRLASDIKCDFNVFFMANSSIGKPPLSRFVYLRSSKIVSEQEKLFREIAMQLNKAPND